MRHWSNWTAQLREGSKLPSFFFACAVVALVIGLSLNFRWKVHRTFFDQEDEGELTLKHWAVGLSIVTSLAYILFYRSLKS